MMPSLRLHGAEVRHGRDVALQGVDLQVEPGERLAVMGPNGGGKTTLVRLLLGLERLAAGRREGTRWPRRPALAPQVPGFDRGFPATVAAVVAASAPGSPTERRERAAAALADFGLEHLARAYLSELSGGELKRVLLARAFAADPDFLVLDEPTAGLDGRSRERLWQRLARLDPAVTVILVTHETPLPSFVPTRSLWVDRRVETLPEAGHG